MASNVKHERRGGIRSRVERIGEDLLAVSLPELVVGVMRYWLRFGRVRINIRHLTCPIIHEVLCFGWVAFLLRGYLTNRVVGIID